jgi:hypothetical protein
VWASNLAKLAMCPLDGRYILAKIVFAGDTIEIARDVTVAHVGDEGGRLCLLSHVSHGSLLHAWLSR